jgi:hypothetical protein
MAELTSFWITSSISLGVSVAVCLSTKPVPSQVSRRFYRFARPPGAWFQTKQMCFTSGEAEDIDHENRLDLACTGLIAIVQLSLYVLSVSVVAKAWWQVLVLALIVCAVSPLVYFKWYVKLADRPVGLRSDLHTDLLGN